MESTIDFEVNTALKECLSDPRQIATGEADAALLACEDEDDTGINDDIVNEALDPIIDAVAANPEALLQCHVFDSLQFLLKWVLQLLMGLINASGLRLGSRVRVSAKCSI